MMPRRNEYVARRVRARMVNRGEPMILRHVSLLPGPQPFRSPPDTAQVNVRAVNTIDGQVYLNLAGDAAQGRLVPGDVILCASGTARVVTMPTTITTDSDGIPQVDPDGAPVVGSPIVYSPDTLAWDNVFPVVPVDFSIDPLYAGDPAVILHQLAEFKFLADETVYGNPLSYEQMTAMGWVEVDTIGLSLAGFGVSTPPKVNDIIILVASGGERRAILQTGRRFSNGQNFLLPVQVR